MSSGTDLDAHLSLLRRRWLVLVGCVVVGGTAALALLRIVPPAYTATAQVLVLPIGAGEQVNQVTARHREALNLDTEAQIARSAVVAARAARTLGVDAVEPVEAAVPPNSSVLLLSVTAADPEAAAARATAYAEAYLAHRRESALTAMARQQEAVLTKLKQVNAAIDRVIRQLATLPKGPERAIAVQRHGVLNRQAAGLAVKYDALRTVAVTPGTIISRPVPPAAPSSPSLPLYLGTGLMLGLLAGVAAAYVRDRLDTRLRTPADVERLTGLPVLGDLSGPRRPGVLHDLASSLVAACPGKRLLVVALPADLYSASLSEPLAVSAPLVVLDGTDVRDLSRADAAVLLIGLGRVTSREVAAAARRLARHSVPLVGAVTATDAVPSFVPLLEPHPPASLGKLVATGELRAARPGAQDETGPLQTLRRRHGRST
ncbi:Wzz/FepE/Etk N-terminal domain-containing protein [Nonomuraea sp. NPDC049309]|uniref:Wzz/FepE/Etk N-terminal domain-containing protein n=1 Tax=Nonomuraea sp. NPDC049309 TaxID=3364350 RepID=UPI0037105D6F